MDENEWNEYQTVSSDESFEPQNQNYSYAVASMILGILALLFSCACINIPLAVLSIIFGVIHLTKKSIHNGMAVAGFITSGISIAFTVIALVSLIAFSHEIVTDSGLIFDDFIQEYAPDDSFDFDDYDYDEYDGHEGYINGIPMDEIGDI